MVFFSVYEFLHREGGLFCPLKMIYGNDHVQLDHFSHTRKLRLHNISRYFSPDQQKVFPSTLKVQKIYN